MTNKQAYPWGFYSGAFFTNLKIYKMKTTYPTHPMRDFNEWITAVHNYFRMTAAEYERNKTIRTYTRFRIEPDGKGYYIVGEEKIPQKEFEKQFPLPLFIGRNEENPNSTTSYITETI